MMEIFVLIVHFAFAVKGGTLPQKISSCLEVLDSFMKQSCPVVASMVVAEKRKSGESGSVVDCVSNILGM
jgi:fatty acid synthase